MPSQKNSPLDTFHVGDIVSIKDSGFLREHRSDYPSINSDMREAAGADATIIRIWRENGRTLFRLSAEDYSFKHRIDDWIWNAEWVNPMTCTSAVPVSSFMELFDD